MPSGYYNLQEIPRHHLKFLYQEFKEMQIVFTSKMPQHNLHYAVSQQVNKCVRLLSNLTFAPGPDQNGSNYLLTLSSKVSLLYPTTQDRFNCNKS